MFKRLLLVATLLISSGAAAYSITVKNATGSAVLANLIFATDVCEDKDIALNAKYPGHQKKIQSGLCCLKEVKLRITAGKFTGKKVSFKTGSSRCSNYTFIAKMSGDQFLIEQE